MIFIRKFVQFLCSKNKATLCSVKFFFIAILCQISKYGLAVRRLIERPKFKSICSVRTSCPPPKMWYVLWRAVTVSSFAGPCANKAFRILTFQVYIDPSKLRIHTLFCLPLKDLKSIRIQDLYRY